MNGTAVEPGAKPSAHGRSEIFPAMNRLLTPAGNVRSDSGQPRDGTAPSSFAPEPPLLFSVFSMPVGEVRNNRMSQLSLFPSFILDFRFLLSVPLSTQLLVPQGVITGGHRAHTNVVTRERFALP